MRIILAGGGTGGPVAPLIAVQQKIKEDHPGAKFLLAGANKGLEQIFAKKYGLEFVSIPSGKLRRYFSLANFFAPFFVLAGIIKAIFIIRRFKADAVFSAGGFVSVPVGIAAFIMRKKILIHQQDVMPSLTNKILAPFARKITVSFKSSVKDFFSGSGLFKIDDRKIAWTGNPVRAEIREKESKDDILRAKKHFGLNSDQPVLLVLGGGTGAQGLNIILEEALPELIKNMQVLHSTGTGKGLSWQNENYHSFEIIEDMAGAYNCADIVVSRAGLSTISELSALKKVSIIIPMPESHQIENALYLQVAGAAVVLNQEFLDGPKLAGTIKQIMYDAQMQKVLKENIGQIMPGGATAKIAKILEDLCSK